MERRGVPDGRRSRARARDRADARWDSGRREHHAALPERIARRRVPRLDIPDESLGSVAPELQCRDLASEERVQEIGTATDSVRDRLDRILSSYDEMDRRFMAAGGLGSLLNLYEQVRRELERVSFEELDRMTHEIKTVIEALLKMDYELRKVHNLKLAFEARTPSAGSLG
jgi:hypothetical protein